jgi:hypothetical protein
VAGGSACDPTTTGFSAESVGAWGAQGVGAWGAQGVGAWGAQGVGACGARGVGAGGGRRGGPWGFAQAGQGLLGYIVCRPSRSPALKAVAPAVGFMIAVVSSTWPMPSACMVSWTISQPWPTE